MSKNNDNCLYFFIYNLLEESISKFMLFASVIAMTTITACSGGDSDSPELVEDPPTQLEKGFSLYQEHCSFCHADQVDGVFDLESQEIYDISDITDFIIKMETDGRTEGCDEDCAIDIATYIDSFHSFPDPNDAVITRGKTLFFELQCAECHLPDTDNVFHLADKKIYDETALAAFIHNAIEIAGFLETCGETCATDVAAYISSYHTFPEAPILGPLACSEAIICGDFEDEELQHWSIGDQVMVATQDYYNGNQGIKACTSEDDGFGANFATVELSDGYELVDQMHWGRVISKTENLMEDHNRIALIELGRVLSHSGENLNSERLSLSFGIEGSENMEQATLAMYYNRESIDNVLNTSVQTTDCVMQSSEALQEEVWSCLEWQLDTVTKDVKFWVNNTEVSFTPVDEVACGFVASSEEWSDFESLDVISFGSRGSEGTGDTKIYYDAVRVDTERVGCPQEFISDDGNGQDEISEEERALRISEGKALYEGDSGNICTTCHGLTKEGGPIGGPLGLGFENGGLICNVCRTGSYLELVEIINTGDMDGDGMSEMAPCKPEDNCAEKIADYIWAEFNGFTLTKQGGIR